MDRFVTNLVTAVQQRTFQWLYILTWRGAVLIIMTVTERALASNKKL